jgi:hypothetical protein
MALARYDAARFESQVRRAMDSVQRILEANRLPKLASKVHHRYEDKFVLAECLVNLSVASQLNSLAHLGLTRAHVEQIVAWAKDRAVSLQFRASERSEFVRKEEKEIEDKTKYVRDEKITGADGNEVTSHTEHKVVTAVTEYFWRYEMQCSIIAYRGTNPAEGSIEVLRRTGSHEIKTTTDANPGPSVLDPAAEFVLDISWLLRVLNAEAPNAPCFSVQRAEKSCATPRRNKDVDGALDYFREFSKWSGNVQQYLKKFSSFLEENVSRAAKNAVSSIFLPVLPLLDETVPTRECMAVRLDRKQSLQIFQV